MSTYHWQMLDAGDVLAILIRESFAADSFALSGFLEPAQWRPLAANDGIELAGGSEFAYYRRAGWGTTDIPVAHYRAPAEQLPAGFESPRALRSFFVRKGIEYSAVGDIQIGPEYVLVTADPAVDFRRTRIGLEPVDDPLPVVKIRSATAASLRADAVVATVFKLPRKEGQQAIADGSILLNDEPLTSRRQQLEPGDHLLFDGRGCVELLEDAGSSRQGRVKLEFRYFPA